MSNFQKDEIYFISKTKINERKERFLCGEI